MNSVFLEVVWVLTAPLIIGIAGLAAKRAISIFENQFNVTLEADMRNTLHSAATTGLKAALSLGMSRTDAVNYAVDYAVSKGAPEAFGALLRDNPRVENAMNVMEELVLSKVDEVVFQRETVRAIQP